MNIPLADLLQAGMPTSPEQNGQLRPIRVIGAACGRGAGDIRCGEGPQALRTAGIVEHLARMRPNVAWDSMLDCSTPGLSALEAVAELCPRLAERTSAAVRDGAMPLVLTGDHSCAIGTWAGISTALQLEGALGLLWVDAHLDSHTPDTSHTGNLHGMPLAALLGYGESSLTRCGGPGPKLLAQNVCIVGVRSFEAEEVRFLAGLGVRVFYMDEVRRRGLPAVLEDALQLVQAETKAFGISLDLDVIDPTQAPGVGTPAALGVDAAGLRLVLHAIGNHPRFAGLEITEYNPMLDRNGMTAKVVLDLLDDIFAATDRQA